MRPYIICEMVQETLFFFSLNCTSVYNYQKMKFGIIEYLQIFVQFVFLFIQGAVRSHCLLPFVHLKCHVKI